MDNIKRLRKFECSTHADSLNRVGGGQERIIETACKLIQRKTFFKNVGQILRPQLKKFEVVVILGRLSNWGAARNR